MTVSLTIVGSIVVVVLGWYLNEQSKKKWEAYKRKEDNYKELIRTLRGFYIDKPSKELKEEFLYQVNLCWLYSPDEVIKAAYGFLDTVHAGVTSTDAVKEKAVSSLVLAMREDILSGKTIDKTELTAGDFKHLKAR